MVKRPRSAEEELLCIHRDLASEVEGDECIVHDCPAQPIDFLRFSRSFRATPVIFQDSKLQMFRKRVLHLRRMVKNDIVEPWAFKVSGSKMAAERKRMPYVDFLRKSQSGEELLYLQLRGLQLGVKRTNSPNLDERKRTPNVIGKIGREINIPSFLEPAKIRECNWWEGRCQTSNLHMDGLDNILHCISGEKIIHLYSPWDTIKMYPRGRDKVPIQSCFESFRFACSRKHPQFFEAKRHKARLQAGQSLFIPAGWWHEVVTPVHTLALNFWIEREPGNELRPSIMYLRSEKFYQFWAEKESNG